jgi:hypothetical protein
MSSPPRPGPRAAAERSRSAASTSSDPGRSARGAGPRALKPVARCAGRRRPPPRRGRRPGRCPRQVGAIPPRGGRPRGPAPTISTSAVTPDVTGRAAGPALTPGARMVASLVFIYERQTSNHAVRAARTQLPWARALTAGPWCGRGGDGRGGQHGDWGGAVEAPAAALSTRVLRRSRPDPSPAGRAEPLLSL